MLRITPFVDEGLGHSSYLVDLGNGEALAVDPPRIPNELLAAAARQGLRVSVTADTHSHADYISGSPALAAGGAMFLASADAQLAIPHRPVRENDEIHLAPGLALHAIATPGHTPDHLAYLLTARDRPVALFSGGSLMVGTVGRTDLLGDELREPLARSLYRALHARILTLPDDLPVYPTHGAGSFCSAPGAGDRTTTIGRERTTNPLLQARDEDAFVEQLLAGFGSFPAYFTRLPEVNRLGPRVYTDVPRLAALDAVEFANALASGAVIVDARPLAAFGRAHIPGALSIELRSVFASWLGWLVPPDRPLLFVLDADQDRDDLVRQCLEVGYEQLVGELAGGIDAWRAAGHYVTRIDIVGADRMAPNVLDVRQANEYNAGHIPGAQNIELGELHDATTAVASGPVTVMCGHGERAMTGASILKQAGHDDVTVLAGGPDDWSAAHGRALE